MCSELLQVIYMSVSADIFYCLCWKHSRSSLLNILKYLVNWYITSNVLPAEQLYLCTMLQSLAICHLPLDSSSNCSPLYFGMNVVAFTQKLEYIGLPSCTYFTNNNVVFHLLAPSKNSQNEQN